jgi:hypothetical protein
MPLDNASSRVGVMCLLIGIRYLCTYKGGCLLDLRIHITSMSTNVQFMVCFVLYSGLHLPRDDCHFGYKQKFLKKHFLAASLFPWQIFSLWQQQNWKHFLI